MTLTGSPALSTTTSRRPATASTRSRSARVARPSDSARAIVVGLTRTAVASWRWLRSAIRRARRTVPGTSRHSVMRSASSLPRLGRKPHLVICGQERRLWTRPSPAGTPDPATTSLLRSAVQRRSRPGGRVPLGSIRGEWLVLCSNSRCTGVELEALGAERRRPGSPAGTCAEERLRHCCHPRCRDVAARGVPTSGPSPNRDRVPCSHPRRTDVAGQGPRVPGNGYVSAAIRSAQT